LNGSGFFAASGVFGGDVHAPSADASGAPSVGSQQPQYAGRGVAAVSDTDSVGFPAYLGAGRFAANETSSRDRRQSFASRVARVSRLERASKMIDYFESFIHSFIHSSSRTHRLSLALRAFSTIVHVVDDVHERGGGDARGDDWWEHSPSSVRGDDDDDDASRCDVSARGLGYE